MFKQTRRSISIIILVAFISTSIKTQAYAQSAQLGYLPQLPAPGVLVHLSPEFTPALLAGITIHPDNALKFDFIIQKGDQILDGNQKKDEYRKLVKYFMASLTIPDEDQWVNLSPYEKNRIIAGDFGKTEMGRDLLAEDYMLKQITSSLIYPEDGLGKQFWDKIYERAWKEYHTTDVPVNTFNKVWIVPDKAVVYESGSTAYILQSHLKVMLEEDYLSLKKHNVENNINSIGSQIIREIVLPALEQEVNEGKNFANLRQMYSGMVLATWYKTALKQSLLGKVYADKSKVKGIDQNPRNNELIYKEYLKAFKKGVFNFIKEDVDKYTNTSVPRKYFSGGFGRTKGVGAVDEEVLHSASQVAQDPSLVNAVENINTNGMDLAMVTLQEGPTQRTSGIPLKLSAQFAVDKAFEELMRPENAAFRRLLDVDSEEYKLLDPQGVLRANGIRIYILRGFKFKVIQYDPMDAPGDLISHASVHEKIGLDAIDFETLKIEPEPIRIQWAQQNLYYILGYQRESVTSATEAPDAPAPVVTSVPAVIPVPAAPEPVVTPAPAAAVVASNRRGPYHPIYRAQLIELQIRGKGNITVSELYKNIMSHELAKGKTLSYAAFSSYIYHSINPPNFIIETINDLLKNPTDKQRLRILRRVTGLKIEDLLVLINKSLPKDETPLHSRNQSFILYGESKLTTAMRDHVDGLLKQLEVMTPDQIKDFLKQYGLPNIKKRPSADKNTKKGAVVTAAASELKAQPSGRIERIVKLRIFKQSRNTTTSALRDLLIKEPEAPKDNLPTTSTFTTYLTSVSPPDWVLNAVDRLSLQEFKTLEDMSPLVKKMHDLRAMLKIRVDSFISMLNQNRPAGTTALERGYVYYGSMEAPEWVSEAVDKIEREFNGKSNDDIKRMLLDKYQSTQKELTKAEIEYEKIRVQVPATPSSAPAAEKQTAMVEQPLTADQKRKKLKKLKELSKITTFELYDVVKEEKDMQQLTKLTFASYFYRGNPPEWLMKIVDRLLKKIETESTQVAQPAPSPVPAVVPTPAPAVTSAVVSNATSIDQDQKAINHKKFNLIRKVLGLTVLDFYEQHFNKLEPKIEWSTFKNYTNDKRQIPAQVMEIVDDLIRQEALKIDANSPMNEDQAEVKALAAAVNSPATVSVAAPASASAAVPGVKVDLNALLVADLGRRESETFPVNTPAQVKTRTDAEYMQYLAKSNTILLQEELDLILKNKKKAGDKLTKRDMIEAEVYSNRSIVHFDHLQRKNVVNILLNYRGKDVPNFTANKHDHIIQILEKMTKNWESLSLEDRQAASRVLGIFQRRKDRPTLEEPPMLFFPELESIEPVVHRQEQLEQLKEILELVAQEINEGTKLGDDDMARDIWKEIAELKDWKGIYHGLDLKTPQDPIKVIRAIFENSTGVIKYQDKKDISLALYQTWPGEIDYRDPFTMDLIYIMMDYLPVNDLWKSVDSIFMTHKGRPEEIKTTRFLKKLLQGLETNADYQYVVSKLTNEKISTYGWTDRTALVQAFRKIAEPYIEKSRAISFDTFAQMVILGNVKEAQFVGERIKVYLKNEHVYSGHEPIIMQFGRLKSNGVLTGKSSTGQNYEIEQAKIDRVILLDRAMTAPLNLSKSDEALITRNGGIDFNGANLNLQIKRDGRGVPLPLSKQDMAQLSHILGFEPEIVGIKSAVNVPIIRELQQNLQFIMTTVP